MARVPARVNRPPTGRPAQVTARNRLAALEAERQGQERQLRSLLDAAQAGVSSLALREVLQRVLGAVRDLVGSGAAAVWRVDESGVLRHFGSVGLSERYVRAATRAGQGDLVTDLVLQEGRPVAVSDILLDISPQPALVGEGVRS